jgi:peptide/nickel transport system permease protein
MSRYVLKRLLFLVFVLLGAALLIFLLTTTIPADPAREALGEYATPQQVAAYREMHGLDDPIWTQFRIYMLRVLQGNFGQSIVSGGVVSEELLRYLPATVELMLVAILLSVLIGVPLGIISAVRRGGVADNASRFLSLFGMSMPVFWLGLMMQFIFYGQLGLLPLGQRLPGEVSPPSRVTGLYTVDSLLALEFGTFWLACLHLMLPALALSANGLAAIARITRSSFLEVLRSDYMQTARAKGIKERLVIIRHALPNAINPIITIIGLRIGDMFGGAVITETIFAWPGLGRWAIAGLLRGDMPVIVAFTLFAVLMYAIVNLIVDLLYPVFDPRIRLG